MRRSLALLAVVPLALAASAARARPIGETPPGAKELASMEAYVTALAADEGHVYWGAQEFKNPNAGGVYRVDLATGAQTTLWSDGAPGKVRVGAADVFFSFRMDGSLGAIAKDAAAGTAPRVLLDEAALAKAEGKPEGTALHLVDFAVAGDRLVLAIRPFGPCADGEGAVVTTALDGTDAHLIAKTCPSPLSVDATHVYWREWGKKKDDGKREPDRIVRAALAAKAPPKALEVLVTAPLYLDPVVVGDAVFYCDETMRKEGFGGLVKVPKAGGKPSVVIPNVGWSLGFHAIGPKLLAIDPIKDTLRVIDPKSGAPTDLPDANGLGKVVTHDFDYYYAVCDSPTRCVIRTMSFVDPNDLQLP